MNWEVWTMRSVTSCFNPTLFRKNLSRFWPLWAVYGAIWLVAMPLVQFVKLFGWQGEYYRESFEKLADMSVREVLWHSETALWLALVFGLLFAMALFSYLMNARSVGMMHSFPIRRESLFLTSYLTGAAAFTAVHGVAALLTGAIQTAAGVSGCWQAVGAWFLAAEGMMLFFYSFAVFCTMFTGQILAAPVFYGVLNGLAAGLNLLIQNLGEAFYYGFSAGTPAWVWWLTPLYRLSRDVGLDYQWDESLGYDTAHTLSGLGTVGVYALAGLALAGLALWACRVRRSETAGDVVSFRWARHLFRWGVSLCLGLSLGQALYYMLWTSFGGDGDSLMWMMVCVLLLALVGWFAAEMLLEKSFRVFRRGWKGGLVMTAVLLALGVCLHLDVLGVENRVPPADQVQSVSLSVSGRSGVSGVIEDPEIIERILAFHTALVAEKEEQKTLQAESRESGTGLYNWGWTELTYFLKNGGSMSRSYYVYVDSPTPSGPAALLEELVTDPVVQRANILGGLTGSRVSGGELEVYQPDRQEWEYVSIDNNTALTLYDALVADIDAGNFGTSVLLSEQDRAAIVYVNTLTLYYVTGSGRTSSQSFSFTKNCVHLVEALETSGIVSEDYPLLTHAEAWPEDYADGAGERSAAAVSEGVPYVETIAPEAAF